ncbi:hypothetical protein [uncultured Bacteroides sp.]|uniref:hypothetical protein n=1 Tax=uncultured Bacteroides sp. TaxID=162156 RepID=UPI002AA8FE59|nr:hypothetical protein [uncultured Bacteroides sp.]
MRKNYLQKKITTGKFTLPVVILISITCWVVTAFLVPNLPEQRISYSLFQLLHFPSMPVWVAKTASFILYAVIGYFLIELNNSFSIIRMRASIQTSLYFLFIAACPMLHQLHTGDIAAIALLISVYFLFKSYQSHQASAYLFHSFAFIGAGSLFFPQLTALVPIWFIGAYGFQSLNLRSFFASIIGWSVPYWFLFGHAFYYGNMELFYKPFNDLVCLQPLNFGNIQSSDWATLGYLFILFAVSSIHCLAASYQDKIRTRSYLRFLIFLNMFLFIFTICQPEHMLCLLSLLLMGISILAGHLFALTQNKASNIFFLFSLIGLISLYLFNLWLLL